MRWLVACALLGCSAATDPLPAVEEEQACAPGALDHPQALAFVGDRLVVANTAYGVPWGEGSIAVVDVEAGRVEAVLPTTWRNPQALAVVGETVWVAETGLYDFAPTPPQMATPGGVERFALDQPGTAAAFELDRGPELRAGGPVAMQVVGDRLFVGSGIAARVQVFDLTEEKWIRGPANPIAYGEGLGLASLATDGTHVFVIDYNSDRLHVLDARTGDLGCSVDLGETPRLEGAKAPLVVGTDLYYVLDQAGLLRRVALAGLDAPGPGPCPGVVPETVAVTGLLPNHLVQAGDLLYLVHSGENNVTALRLTDLRTVAVHVLPPGSNPWQVAVHPTRPLLAVSEWQASGVTLVDLTDGTQRRLRCGVATEDEAPDAGVDPLEGARLADEVRAAPSASDAPFHDPARAANGVHGAGATHGGLDVFSLGTQPGVDDHVVLCWSDGPVLDGPGADLVVFENPFAGFLDPVVVEASPDGERWVAFPHDYLAADETVYEADPALWSGFAGLTPVWLNEDRNRVDPLGAAAGGDTFDLADLHDPEIDATGALCVRLTSAQARVNPDTGAPFVVDPVSDGADIDGVYGRAR